MGRKNAEIKVLVTGGAGFVGKQLVKELLKRGYKVVVVDRKPKAMFPSFDCEYLSFDLTNPKFTKKAMRGVDYCLHLANESGGIGFTRRFPATILSENNKINSSVFEAAAEENIKRIVFISSSMIFELARLFPAQEADVNRVLTPKTGYSFSKLMGERLCASYWEQYGLSFTVCRPSNIYGIDEYLYLDKDRDFSHVIPDFVRKVLSGQYPLEIYGDGQQSRCFTHISDAVRGIIMAMRSTKAHNEDINIADSREVKIIDLAKMIYDLCEPDKPFRARFIRGFPDDVKKNIISNDKARRLLGWEPKRRLEEELPKIIKWVKDLFLFAAVYIFFSQIYCGLYSLNQ